MISNENIEFEILDILKFHRKSIFYKTSKRNLCAISCRLNGSTDFFSDGSSVHASKYDYIIIPAGIDYSQQSSDEDVITIHLSFKTELFDKITSIHVVNPVIQQYFIELYNIWSKKKSGYIFECKSLIYHILYEFLQAQYDCNIIESNTALHNAVNFIYDNYHKKNFKISEAIEHSFFSPAYFRSLFKKTYGVRPIEFVNELKINYAKALLESGSYTIKEIADITGFSDEKYFFTVFKKVTGYTPSEWRIF